MKEIIDSNYDSTVKRGLITDETTFNDFMDKIYEEAHEASIDLKYSGGYSVAFWFEIADIILACLNLAHHYDMNIENILKEKIKINYSRVKK